MPNMLSYFDTTFLSQIPDQLLNVPDLVQEKTGIVMQIQDINNSSFDDIAPAFAKARAVLDIDVEAQTITLWVGPESDITPHMLGHELIHLRRNVLEGVHKIFPRADVNVGISQEALFLENELEHLFVIPEEISLFPEAEAWWTEYYRQQIQKARTEPVAMAHHWRTIRIALPKQKELLDACAAIILGFDSTVAVGLANNFHQFIANVMPNKREMILEAIHMYPAPAVRGMGLARFNNESRSLSLDVIARAEDLPRPGRLLQQGAALSNGRPLPPSRLQP
jgi:hypothetical protein